jgi:tetratricopeptide (TPR) repeat protein
MVTIYLLLMPETWLQKAKDLVAPAFVEIGKRARTVLTGPYAWLAFGAALALGMSVSWLLPLPAGTVMTLLIMASLLAIVDLLLSRRPARAAMTHLAATFSLLLFVHSTNSVRDYFRFWGGQERRSGNTSAAIIAYEDLVRYEPGYSSGHRRLGDLYNSVLRVDEAIAQYEAGLAIDPDDFALNKAAAQAYHATGNGEWALQCAERALKAEQVLKKKKKDQAIRRIRDHWKRKLQPNAKRP